ncbi:hypothetical protein SmJEL517_g02552 [Synchytrium microbalum]|uniref:Protein kinase domain-containing protein n=1 Tax=Synchytrium microbalum TaxID=1806994 RepID=A0A507CBB3_9FUNG|nr:uncharacterized protein SmJEL517_g02552 [Synchytrium microbalum]TPX34823.1 hypothetical protein SmJEL517_g02552 [Synchytrium microbalum]
MQTTAPPATPNSARKRQRDPSDVEIILPQHTQHQHQTPFNNQQPYNIEDRIRKKPRPSDPQPTTANYRVKARNTAAQLFNQVVKNSHDPARDIPPVNKFPTTTRTIVRGQVNNNTTYNNNIAVQQQQQPYHKATSPPIAASVTSSTLNALVSESKSYTYDDDQVLDEDEKSESEGSVYDDDEEQQQQQPLPQAKNAAAIATTPHHRIPRVEVTVPVSGTDGRSKALNAVRNAVKTSIRLSRDYELSHILGWGHNGVVLLGSQYNSATSRRKKVAIKLIYKRNENLGRLETNAPSEITMLQGIRHQCIVQYVAHWEDPNVWYLVQEFVGPSTIKGQEYITCTLPPARNHPHSTNNADAQGRLTIANDSGSDLWVLNNQYHRKRKEAVAKYGHAAGNEGMPPSLRQKLFIQIASAVAHLHSNNIVHADIKEENIVVTSTLQRPKCKLTDFGHAFYTNGTARLKYHSTSRLSAPECWKNVELRNEGKQHQELFEGKKQDTWSLGLVLFSMINGGLPSNHDQIVNGDKSIGTSDYYPAITRLQEIATPDEMHLLKRMLAINHKKRYGMDEVMQDVYVTNKPSKQNHASSSGGGGGGSSSRR